VLTSAHTDRALAPESLAAAAQRAGWRGPVEIEGEPSRALDAAWRHAPAICAAGSIFLVGEVLARLGPDT
jgi:folylpolyglutamate synthase/dihydropteroate synthase